jgi:hypothetical protein
MRAESSVAVYASAMLLSCLIAQAQAAEAEAGPMKAADAGHHQLYCNFSASECLHALRK